MKSVLPSPSHFLTATERLLFIPQSCLFSRLMVKASFPSSSPHRTCALSPYPSWWPLLASLKFINISLVLEVQSWMYCSRCDLMSTEARGSITFPGLLAMVLMIQPSMLYPTGHSWTHFSRDPWLNLLPLPWTLSQDANTSQTEAVNVQNTSALSASAVTKSPSALSSSLTLYLFILLLLT